TEGLIAIFSQFGGSTEQLEKNLGSINAVAAQFAVESTDIITAVRKAGSAFKNSGGSLEEYLALFTAVRSTTRESADTIATGFRTIFPRLQRPEVLDFLRSFNIELTEIGKNGEEVFVGPFEAIKRINAVISQLPTGDVRLAQIVEQIGGLRQFNKVLPL